VTVSISHPVFDTVGPTKPTVESTQPATLSTLLRELGMSHTCVGKQWGALHTWLMIHEAQRPLRISLRENGYGLLLKLTDEERAKPRSLA
jgi:hypothetical protein